MVDSLKEYIVKEDTRRAEYVKSLQLKLTKDLLTDKQIKDFLKRANVKMPQSPAQLSAIADIEAMNKDQLQQIINQKNFKNLLMKHRARLRLKGVWK
jgi:hypothetical protein